MSTVKPEAILEAFEESVALADRLRYESRKRGAPNADLVIEAEIRLKQALYFLKRFRTLELEHAEKDALLFKVKTPEEHKPLADRVRELTDEIKTNGEAFYYFAFRAYKAFASVGVDFDPRGVILVRNKLIEHPHNQPGGMLVGHWMFACDEGLVLVPGLGERNGPDAGLYPNALEFIEKLVPKMKATLPV